LYTCFCLHSRFDIADQVFLAFLFSRVWSHSFSPVDSKTVFIGIFIERVLRQVSYEGSILWKEIHLYSRYVFRFLFCRFPRSLYRISIFAIESSSRALNFPWLFLWVPFFWNPYSAIFVLRPSSFRIFSRNSQFYYADFNRFLVNNVRSFFTLRLLHYVGNLRNQMPIFSIDLHLLQLLHLLFFLPVIQKSVLLWGSIVDWGLHILNVVI
jgi:hypothetical protein